MQVSSVLYDRTQPQSDSVQEIAQIDVQMAHYLLLQNSRILRFESVPGESGSASRTAEETFVDSRGQAINYLTRSVI